jgi:hypothetical protein
MVQPREIDAEAFSKDRLAPMLRDTPALHGKVSEARSRDSRNTILHKKFLGGTITLSAANSPEGLAMRSIRYCLLDEIDRYPASAGAEGDPVNLAITRTANFWNRKIVMCSTPKNAIGEQFLPLIREAITGLTDLAKWAKENAKEIANLAKTTAQLALVIISYNLPGLLLKIAAGVRAISLAARANPWGLVVASPTALGFALHDMKQRLDESAEAMQEAARRARLLEEIRAGRSADELRKLGYTADQIRQALLRTSEAAKNVDLSGFSARIGEIIAGERDLQAELERQRELRTRIKQAEEKAHDLLISAQKQEFDGLVAKILTEYRIYRQEIGLSAKATIQ